MGLIKRSLPVPTYMVYMVSIYLLMYGRLCTNYLGVWVGSGRSGAERILAPALSAGTAYYPIHGCTSGRILPSLPFYITAAFKALEVDRFRFLPRTPTIRFALLHSYTHAQHTQRHTEDPTGIISTQHL